MDTEETPVVKPKGLDLASLNTTSASNKGAEIELLHPTENTPLGIYITVLGKDSDVFRDHVKHDVNQRLRKEAMATKRGKSLDPTTAEQVEEQSIELLTICTTGWRNMVYNGEELAFTVANVAMVYRELLWVRRQIDEAIGDLENFM